MQSHEILNKLYKYTKQISQTTNCSPHCSQSLFRKLQSDEVIHCFDTDELIKLEMR